MIDRRTVLATAAVACVAWIAMLPRANAKPAKKVHRLGMLSSGTGPLQLPLVSDFDERLRELGYLEGENLHVERRYAGAAPERQREFAQQLVDARPDVIVTWGENRLRALQDLTSTIPIVGVAGDFMRTGLVKSLGRPGGNVTGVSIYSPELAPKRLQMLKEAVPSIKRVTALLCPADEPAFGQLQAAALQLGVTLAPVTVRTRQQVKSLFDTLRSAPPDALLVLDCGVIHTGLVANRLPASYYNESHARHGALMSYGHRWQDTDRRLADYVHRIFKGAKAADLPVEQPTRFSLVINLKTAKALGITIPRSLLLQADELIQ